MNPEYKERLNNKWIHENLYKEDSVVIRTSHDYLGDYDLLGLAWLKVHEVYNKAEIGIILAFDGVYRVNKADILYSGHAYDFRVQLIWSIDVDCRAFGLPETPMACCYGAIVDLLLNLK